MRPRSAREAAVSLPERIPNPGRWSPADDFTDLAWERWLLGVDNANILHGCGSFLVAPEKVQSNRGEEKGAPQESAQGDDERLAHRVSPSQRRAKAGMTVTSPLVQTISLPRRRPTRAPFCAHQAAK